MTDDRRTTDERGPTDDGRPIRFESRLPGRGRAPIVPIAALVLLVGIAALTAEPGSGPPADRGAAATDVAAIAAAASPSPSEPGPDAGVTAICLDPASWRTATIETWRDQTVRVWRAIDPVPASGPNDPAIPIVPAVGSRVAAIGFCAPVVGPNRPTGPVSIQAWRREATPGDGPNPSPGPGAGRGASAVPLDLRSAIPTGSPSPFGALFAAPDPAAAGSGWGPGIVVFRYSPVDGGGSAPVATWFAIEVSLTDAAVKASSLPSPPPTPAGETTRP